MLKILQSNARRHLEVVFAQVRMHFGDGPDDREDAENVNGYIRIRHGL